VGDDMIMMMLIMKCDIKKTWGKIYRRCDVTYNNVFQKHTSMMRCTERVDLTAAIVCKLEGSNRCRNMHLLSDEMTIVKHKE
jgi:hypothetical protein